MLVDTPTAAPQDITEFVDSFILDDCTEYYVLPRVVVCSKCMRPQFVKIDEKTKKISLLTSHARRCTSLL